MASPYLIDPDGDVDLLLPQEALQLDNRFDVPSPPPTLNYRRPITPVPKNIEKKKKKGVRAPTLKSDPEPEPIPSTEPTGSDEYAETAPSPEQNDADIASESDETRIRIRVSSKHLMLASSYFKHNLGSGLAESCTLQSQGHLELAMHGQDLEATLIVMNIIHGRTRQVPRSIDVNMLTKIAVLVDYLQSYEVVEPFSDRWIEHLEEDIPKDYSRGLV